MHVHDASDCLLVCNIPAGVPLACSITRDTKVLSPPLVHCAFARTDLGGSGLCCRPGAAGEERPTTDC